MVLSRKCPMPPASSEVCVWGRVDSVALCVTMNARHARELVASRVAGFV